MTRSILVGGEMLNWSDLHPVDALPPAGGAAARALLAAALRPGDSVLVAGPHELSLLTDLAAGVASVDVLVRSVPDADEIADLLEGTKGQVICGSLDRLRSDDVYDVVVALDGLDRLVGPDTANLTWSGALARLQTRLAPSGRLLLGAANPFGVERFLQPPISAALPRNEDWARDLDDTAPAGRTALVSRLEEAGLDISRTYAVFPSLVEADVALTSVDRLGAVTAARAIAKRNSGPTLMDPYRLVVDAAAADLAVDLAPAWYVVSGDLPDVLPETAVPAGAGVLLEEHLLAALKVDDHAVVRRTITEYVNWLVAQDHPTAAIAAPDNVILDGTSYRLFGDGDPVDAHGEALVVAQLARFARRSLEGGSRQPWPAGGDVRELTARLGSMAGITVTGELLPASELVRPLGSAEQLATVARLAEELAEANARAILFEGMLSGIRRSRPYRVGHAVLNPARVIVRRARRVLGKVVR